MKPLLLSLLITVYAIILAAKGDEKILKQVNALIAKREFQKAADALQKVSSNSRGEIEFLQPATTIYDSLKEYKQAIDYYELLLKGSNNSDAIVTRINFLRSERAISDEAEKLRIEKMKNCMKCSGTGYLGKASVCEKCNGYKIVKKECQRCRGNGRIICNSCQGVGSFYNEDLKMSVGCSKCSGQGGMECTNYCNRGFIDAECVTCYGSGSVTKRVKCDLH